MAQEGSREPVRLESLDRAIVEFVWADVQMPASSAIWAVLAVVAEQKIEPQIYADKR